MALLLRTHDATSSPRSLHARICALACLIALTLSVLAPTAAAALTDPAIQATSALLIEPTSGTVLYELNADETRYPASTTKIMTALVTLENADLTQQITVEEGDFTHVTADSSVAGFKPGEVLTVEQLLYGLMLPSGNDASYILARAVAGDVDTFVQMMNDRAAELGCTGTHFANPCGLHDDNHYTTARDLMRITQAAMANPTFAQIVSTPSYELPATTLQEARTLENSNLLLDSTSSVYYAPAQGIKTGNTTEAGRCLVAAASQNDITLYSVVLGCADAEIPASLTETKRLFEWAYAEWSVQEIVTAGHNASIRRRRRCPPGQAAPNYRRRHHRQAAAQRYRPRGHHRLLQPARGVLRALYAGRRYRHSDLYAERRAPRQGHALRRQRRRAVGAGADPQLRPRRHHQSHHVDRPRRLRCPHHREHRAWVAAPALLIPAAPPSLPIPTAQLHTPRARAAHTSNKAYRRLAPRKRASY